MTTANQMDAVTLVDATTTANGTGALGSAPRCFRSYFRLVAIHSLGAGGAGGSLPAKIQTRLSPATVFPRSDV